MDYAVNTVNYHLSPSGVWDNGMADSQLPSAYSAREPTRAVRIGHWHPQRRQVLPHEPAAQVKGGCCCSKELTSIWLALVLCCRYIGGILNHALAFKNVAFVTLGICGAVKLGEWAGQGVIEVIHTS